MKNFLLSEFDQVSAKQWKQKIQFDLKGADYNETLVWESLEGIKVKPFYHEEDVEGQETFSLPADHTWGIGQIIYAGNPVLANKKALDCLQRGAQSIVFQIPEPTINIEQLLKGTDLSSTPIHFQFSFLDVDHNKNILALTEGKNVKIYLNYDLLGNLAKSGNWYHIQEKDHQILDEIFQLSKNSKGTSVLGVDTSLYQNAGANMVQQLAYGLCQANEYMNHYTSVTSSTVEKSLPISFKVAIGGNYFFEIAKLRALRWLWYSLTEGYGIETDCHILALPSKRNKTLYDYNVNMLRTSSECMAAVLGGVDTVCNLPYDAIYHKDNEFGERIARNQLLLLKEESYFDEAVHAAEGNYYIESLTKQLADKALELFKKIEATGGFLKHLKEGTIQRKIKESAEKEQQLFDKEYLVLVGTNKYHNQIEKMGENLELYPFLKKDTRKTSIEPIIERRLAEQLEQNRLKNE